MITSANLPLLAGDGAPLQSAVLHIHVYNLADVGSRDLTRAELVAAVIFAEAGIATNWSDDSLRNPRELATDFSANGLSSGSCIRAIQVSQLKLQFLRATPRSTFPGALGYALPCARFGVTVTVFVDRCEEVMYHTLASLPKILAHAMAHEIGHVLLASNEHSDSGIMRGLWTRADWRTVAASHMTFLSEQAERMRNRFSIPDQASAIEELPVWPLSR